jgi:hypothetical protein
MSFEVAVTVFFGVTGLAAVVIAFMYATAGNAFRQHVRARLGSLREKPKDR